MSIKLYLDVHVPYAIAIGLRLRGVDVITSQEDKTTMLSDPRLLDRATAVGRILLTQDRDLLSEAKKRQVSGESFAGVIYIHQRKMIIGHCIEDLELISKASDPEDLINRVEYLPFK